MVTCSPDLFWVDVSVETSVLCSPQACSVGVDAPWCLTHPTSPPPQSGRVLRRQPAVIHPPQHGLWMTPSSSVTWVRLAVLALRETRPWLSIRPRSLRRFKALSRCLFGTASVPSLKPSFAWSMFYHRCSTGIEDTPSTGIQPLPIYTCRPLHLRAYHVQLNMLTQRSANSTSPVNNSKGNQSRANRILRLCSGRVYRRCSNATSGRAA